MDNFLTKLLGGASEPNPSAMPPKRTYSAALEKRARANGFRSAEEMVLWSKQRNTPTGGTTRGQMPASMEAAGLIYPPNMLQFILDKWKGAMDR